MPRRGTQEEALAYVHRLRVTVARIDLTRSGAIDGDEPESVVIPLPVLINRVQILNVHKSLGLSEQAASSLLTLDGDEPTPGIMEELERRILSPSDRPSRELGESAEDFLRRLVEVLEDNPETVASTEGLQTARHELAEAEFMEG